MTVDDLVKRPGAWLGTAADSGIVVSSRLRLARNLKEAAFPSWAGEAECERIWKELLPVLQGLQGMSPGFSVAMSELDDVDKQVLFERHLISREQTERGRGSGLVCSDDETLAIMVNEEDHLRLQAIAPGLDLKETWRRIDGADTEIEASFAFAFSPRLGFLTACPTNVGTAMRASVMLHLPGLVLMNQISPIIKGVSKIGLAVRGLWGEGTDAVGNMFQISNQISLGEKEQDIIANIEQIVLEIVNHEKNARSQLMEKREAVLRDHVGRAYGILTNAHLLSSKEALDLLSGLNLGIELGILTEVERKVVHELLLRTQPAHLQKAEGKKLKPKDRDRARADLVRNRLRGERSPQSEDKR